MRKRQKKKNRKRSLFLSLEWKESVVKEFYKDYSGDFTPIFGEEP